MTRVILCTPYKIYKLYAADPQHHEIFQEQIGTRKQAGANLLFFFLKTR